jgi:uncharacterized protein YaiL (DUF2058 family)
MLAEGGEAAEKLLEGFLALGNSVEEITQKLHSAGNTTLAGYLESVAARPYLESNGINTETQKERVKREKEEAKEAEEAAKKDREQEERNKQKEEERKQKESAEQAERAKAKIVSDIFGANKPT